jgi:hypothetical protein
MKRLTASFALFAHPDGGGMNPTVALQSDYYIE